jgi:hypothetical protein
MSVNLDEVRGSVIDRVARSERNFKLALSGAGLFEALFLLAFILAADFRVRLHLLLFLSAVGSYTLVLLGMVALGVYVNRGNLRVLKALELLREER